MMPVVMLGSDYRYSLSAYSRGGLATLGATTSTFDWSGFWKGLGTALDKGVQYGIDYTKARQSQIDSTTYMKIIDDITSGKLNSSQAKSLGESMSAYLPWIIGGAAVLIALMFMVGTRRR